MVTDKFYPELYDTCALYGHSSKGRSGQVMRQRATEFKKQLDEGIDIFAGESLTDTEKKEILLVIETLAQNGKYRGRDLR